MNPKREDTPKRLARRKYEEKCKEERSAATANFQTRIPRKDYDKIDAFLKENNITRVELIYIGYNTLREEREKLKKT